MQFLQTLLIACIPAVITGIITFLVAKSQMNGTIKQLQISNQHDIKKLMEQHKVDIESIREQHRLDLESKDRDHQHKLEIMQKEHENEMIRKEQELESTAKYNAVGDIVTGLMNGVIGGAVNSPAVQKELGQQLAEALKKGNNQAQK